MPILIAQVDGKVRAEPSSAQGTPSHWRDFLTQALFEGAVVEAIQFAQADFDLIDDERHWTRLLQHGELGRSEIADAKLADLARVLEPAEGICHFVRRAEVVRAMQHEEINVIDPKALERLLARPDDVSSGEVIAVRRIGIGIAMFADAAFRSDESARF
jgi:hypothetical protein